MSVSLQSDRIATRRGAKRSRIYLYAALLTTLIAFVGFWSTYFGRMFVGALDTKFLIHAHAMMQVTWLALFITQIALAVAGRVALHIRLGRWVMAYGVVLICVGVIVTFDSFGMRVAEGNLPRAGRFLFGVLKDMVFFAPFLAAGWIYRRRPETHKRLMMVATTILVLPAVSRMTFLGTPVPLWKFMLVWPSPIYIGMIHDYITKRLVHPAYVIGVAAMLSMRLILPLGSSQLWQRIAGWLATFYGAS